MATPLDAEVTALARQIVRLGRAQRPRVGTRRWWTDRLLAAATADPAFKTDLFRLVDVFPATGGDADVLRHLDEYLGGGHAPAPVRAALGAARAVRGLGAPVASRVARAVIGAVAGQFIVGATATAAAPRLRDRWERGRAFTVDLLGERTLIEAEADRYAERVERTLTVLLDATASWPARPRLQSDDAGPLPRVNVSVKPTALAPKLAPLTGEVGLAQAKGRLRPLLRLALRRGAFVNLDMEHSEVKDLTLRLFQELLDEPEFGGLEAGVAVQAYRVDAAHDLARLIAWSAQRPAPVTVRLVKGAYWDTETVVAEAAGWVPPVYAAKAETDLNYERCVRLLHDHHGSVKAAFGSHNPRSLAYAVTYGRSRGIPDTGYELQLLAGMGDATEAALCRLGLRVRVYTPVGELLPGMAYLVRRLLENTSNESFVAHRLARGRAMDRLIAPPRLDRLPEPAAPVRPPTDPRRPGPYRAEPHTEWRRAPAPAGFAAAVATAGAGPRLDVRAVISGRRVRTAETLASVDPARPQVVVATSACCGRAEADAAVEAARAASGAWRRTPVAQRAAVLFGAAAWMRARRHDLAALEVFEAGKPWADADADVCEAIDFCEYYGREMGRLEAWGRHGAVSSAPGEANRLAYQGKGVAAVIAPWNFPLAIPCGMAAGALVAGNCVVLKPAEQTPAVASRLVEAFEAGGLPPGALGFLPGLGEEVGAHLVEHPGVDVVVFTGSRAVGLAINAAAAVHRPGQRSVKRVVAEMGGKNALVVDADADLDQAVPAIVSSAFGYSGQKCSAASRLIALDSVHDQVVERVVAAAAELVIGPPQEMATELGPLIDADAHKRVQRSVELAAAEGRPSLVREDVPAAGFFVGPAVVTDLDPASALAREEVFGPLLAVFRAADLDHALGLANDTDYALTAGILSRSPAHIRRAVAELRAGNVYVNRATTGAVVGRQPFGGHGLSGVGSKAGGPDYLLQLLDPRAVSENTIRQGFAPT
ncbi:MAG: proline dehydrogenase family protein [Acidimicrobiales bacterium]